MLTSRPSVCFNSAQKAVDIGLVDDLGRDDDDRIGGNDGLVATDIFGHQLHALIAPLIGLLHDGGDDRAFLDAAERDRIFVEPDDLDLAELPASFTAS